jgi:hypothetical protein
MVVNLHDGRIAARRADVQSPEVIALHYFGFGG